MKVINLNLRQSLSSILVMLFIFSFGNSHAQIASPDVLHLTFNDQPSSTGKIKNFATNASNYSDSADVVGLTVGWFCWFLWDGTGR